MSDRATFDSPVGAFLRTQIPGLAHGQWIAGFTQFLDEHRVMQRELVLRSIRGPITMLHCPACGADYDQTRGGCRLLLARAARFADVPGYDPRWLR